MIYYIANVRLPTEKAHGIQIAQMLEAFGNFQFSIFPPKADPPQADNFQSNFNNQISKKIEVELVIPYRFNKIKEDLFEYYGVEKNFKVTKLPCLDLIPFGLGKMGFIIQSFSFAKIACFYALIKKSDIIYSRDELPLYFLSFFKKNLFWESHRGEFNFMVKRLLKKCRGVIAITQGLKDFYLKRGARGDKILVASDGVDIEKFKVQSSKFKVREKLNLPQDKKIVLYTGHLYEWKGAAVLLEAAKQSQIPNPKSQILFVLVGGTGKDVKSFKFQVSSFKLNNVLMVGHRPHQEIPYWLKAADVLVLPNSAKEKISRFYTSPLKLFEYMASGTPIVASDLPSIREVLNEKNAVLVKPDSPEFLTAGIMKVLENPYLSDKISKQAFQDVQNYTWEKRAEKILRFIKK